MKSRWFNYRPLFLIFAFLSLGSLFAFFITRSTIICVITTVVVCVFLVVVAVIKKKAKYFFIPLVSFAVGLSAYYIGLNRFESAPEMTPLEISGRIYNVSKPIDGRITAHIDSVQFDGDDVNSNMIIYIYDNSGLFESVEIGRKITFAPMNTYKSDLFYRDTPNSNMYYKNLQYSATVSYQNILFGEIDTTLSEKIKDKIRENFEGVLSNENVEIAYSSLFGDKAQLFDEQYESFRLSGVAHLLAVSGLHVGIIVNIICAIFKLFKKEGWGRLITVAIFVFFYAYICDFSVSVLRACIMAVCLLLSKLLAREYDPLSSISLAGIVLFIINPFVMFDVSFLMSFSCVLGITLLFRPIKKALSKTKMPNWLAISLAMSCATSISLIFIMAYFFKTLNVISLFANIILIPIFTFGFTILFVVSILSLIFPFLRYLMIVVNPIFDFINLTTTVLGNLPISNFATIEIQYFALFVYFVLILILSRICTAKREYRVIITLPILAILVALMI
ncbi:MAG TPA: ComEC/Rec2 family competence protein [Candidatus Onthoplasma faecipullorum]|nr:ComEC/Rec2 family competence protein [Candidatus Onthoplasma faecipullorum]